jgi:hypothetical protein
MEDGRMKFDFPRWGWLFVALAFFGSFFITLALK